jgi:hypothetical protein
MWEVTRSIEKPRVPHFILRVSAMIRRWMRVEKAKLHDLYIVYERAGNVEIVNAVDRQCDTAEPPRASGCLQDTRNLT